MPLTRKTAIVQFELPSGATEGSLPLSTERAFCVVLFVEGRTYPAQNFRSPLNDEQWRDFIRRLRDCNINHDDSGDSGARTIKAITRKLYLALAALSPELQDFLKRTDPRRLVIQTARPELHLLPWAAMFNEAGRLLAADDLSVVHSWQDFSEVSEITGNRLQLLKVMGADTSRVTADALADLPPEIEITDGLAALSSGQEVGAVDILHLEEHGDVAQGLTGGVRSSRLGNTFQNAKMALLWSCNSGAANSWGESPALCLHRDGAGLVLSFLAELHNLDAKSISKAFYADVFGAAASRDPETALLRIRCAKLKSEFYAANWASMTVYLRAPLDLSALALNGPRVPASGWTAGPDAEALSPSLVEVAASWGDLEAKVATLVSKLQPGTMNELDFGAALTGPMPREAFTGWRGNVIRLDGPHQPLSDDVITELNLAADKAPQTDASDRLVWFFGKVARYGSPLIVWTDAVERHLDFVKAVQPSSALTFLLLYSGKARTTATTVAELVDHNRLDEALTLAEQLGPDASDGELSAAYVACARRRKADAAAAYIARLASRSERLLLSANFVSRFPRLPGLPPEQMVELMPEWTPELAEGGLTQLERQRLRKDWYREAMSAPGSPAARRDAGRAKHQLGYLMQKQGKMGAAETLYRMALEDLEHSPKRGIRWHSALGAVLRDWADLLSGNESRLDEARTLLARAMAIHSFHGRKLEMAYSLTTAAEIALTGGHHGEAVARAVDSANSFEECGNWDGWGGAVDVLLNSLAETRETERMLSLTALAADKLDDSGLPADKTRELRRDLSWQRARAHWIAGSLADARAELLPVLANPRREDLEEVTRLARFLGISAVI